MSARVIGSSKSEGSCPLRSLRREKASRKLTTRSVALRCPVVSMRSRVAASSLCQGFVELEAERRVLGGGMMQRRDRQAAQPRGLDRLRVHHVLALRAEANEIAGIGKAYDLTPAIIQDLVEGDGACLDAEEMRCGVALGEHELLGLDPAQGRLCEALLEAAHRTGADGGLESEMRERLHWSGSLRIR